ncbi:zinc finger protein 521-like isoform X2 [Bradysia coprophila]|uniref:zinc finger protein 521-like isoform X2 n=1 Tax=Bradysia coprophila TaxID=38358 RepID=UPI00187DB3CE|nr:zinc finger protein 521-like isoform X2 [Bradysia coprophila]
MKFYCKICNKIFKKFVLFEGHFDFSDECRDKQKSFIECYICNKNFRTSAALKYHIQQHTIKRAKNVTSMKKPQVAKIVRKPVIPKITLKKQWNFKVEPHGVGVDAKNVVPKSPQLECKICGNKFQNLLHLAQHSTEHEKKEGHASSPQTVQENGKRKSEDIESVTSAPITTTKSSVKLHRNQCSVCKIVLRHGGARLVRHMQIHVDGKHKCNVCNIKFSQVSLFWHKKYFHQKQNQSELLADEAKGQQSAKGQKLASQIKSSTNRHLLKKHKGMSTVENKRRRCKICKAIVTIADVQHMQNHKTGKFKCEICNIRFAQRSFVWHQRRFHPEIDIHKCTICKANVPDSKTKQRHLLIHKIGEVKCEVCDIRFTPPSLLMHQKKFHPDLPRLLIMKQACNVCKIICRSKAALDHHDDMHANGEFKCEVHQIRFTFEALQIHNKRWHGKSIVTCPTCKFRFANAEHLERHKKVHVIGSVKCEICDIPFTSCSLVYHQKMFHRELYHGVLRAERMRRKLRANRSQRQKIIASHRFRCTYCKLSYDDPKKLEIHTAVHTDGDVECRICKVRFTKTSLLFHEKRFHPDAQRKERILKAIHRHISDELQGLNELESKDIPIILEDQYKQLKAENNSNAQCVICKLPCGDGKQLDRHITVHIEGDYKCEICSVWFTKNSLEFHQKRFHPEFYEERVANGIKLMKEHGDDVKVNEFSEKKTLKNLNQQCDICKVYAGTGERLEEHKRTHITGDAECKICNIRFTTTALRYHQKRYHPSDYIPQSHEHKCTVCTLTCMDPKQLETHMTVHTEADTQCDICNIPFTVPSLRYHMRRFHADTNSVSTQLLQKALQRNKIEASENALNPLNRNQCPICNLNCDGKKFDVHIKVHIDGDVQCSVCQTWFTPLSLDYHYKRFHPHLYVAKETRSETQYQCNFCKLVSQDETRLKEHMKVHRGNVKCDICNIPFTKLSLIYHYKRFHLNVTEKERILKSIENSAPRKNLHNCTKCMNDSSHEICYHRNAVESVEIPFSFGSLLDADREPIDFPPLLSTPLSVEQDSDESNQVVAIVKRRNYECYVCKEPFKIAYQLQDHLAKHIVYEQWVDPSNVYLSNWDPDELSEIISEQPIVMVENMRNINLKMLAGGPNKNCVDKLQDVNENLTETDLPNTVKNDCTVDPDTTQNHCDDVVEILSESEDEYETIQYQLNKKPKLPFQPEFPGTENDANEPVYISSDDEDNYEMDVTDTFHCYFCNGRFVTLAQFGEHGKICHMKGEPDF